MKYNVQKLEDKPLGKCRKWRLSFRMSEHYANGRWKWKSVRFDGTYTAAKAEAERIARNVEAGTAALPTRWTFAAYAEHWNEAKLAAGAIVESTWRKNRHMLNLYSLHFGGVPLDEVTPAHIENAYAKLRRGESPSGKKLGGTTLRCAHAVGYSMFSHAVDSGIVFANPFAKAMVPKATTKERRALGIAQEVELSLSLDPTEPHELALLLMLEAGLRRGECCALLWDDVDANRIHVHRSMRSDGTIGSVKNGKPRSVPVTSTLNAALVQRRAVCGHGYVLGDISGEPTTPNAMNKWWRANRAKYGLDGWTLHEFRHTYCSNLAEAGVHPKVMQTLMGHTSERTAMQVYTHVNDGQLDAALAAVERAKRA